MKEGIIRILITQQCIYNCFFCHKEGLQERREDQLNKDDLVFLYKIYNKYFGKNELRISGGEPLVREDIYEITKSLHEEGCKVSLTTNGCLLKDKIKVCENLEKLNISIHSLDAEKYKKITNTNINIEEIIENIKSIKTKYPKLKITIDVTLLKGINTDKEEILNFIKLAEELDVKIKFVELFLKQKDYLYEINNLENILLSYGFSKSNEYIRKVEYTKQNTKIYLAKCFCNIDCAPQSKKEFCNKYNDLFLSPDGKINLCRLGKKEIDILEEIKNRDEKALLEKLNLAYKKLGENCQIKGEKIWI